MKKVIALAVANLLLVACTLYQDLYKPDSNYLARRSIETRVFDTSNSKKLLIASAQLIQDMGYTITESDVDLGLITATRMSEKGNGLAKAILAISSAINGDNATYDDKQKFFVSVVNTKVGKKQIKTRVTFARTIYNNLGEITSIEKLDDQKLYAEFFDKLAQSVFLTANNI